VNMRLTPAALSERASRSAPRLAVMVGSSGVT